MSVTVAKPRYAGCVFAEDEASLLIEAARTPAELASMTERRAGGELFRQPRTQHVPVGGVHFNHAAGSYCVSRSVPGRFEAFQLAHLGISSGTVLCAAELGVGTRT